MIIKSEKIGLILLLCLSLTSFSDSPALANNTLNQVDIRKSSSDGLEFTLYTSSPYAENVVVTKKSDNKYVILMPNVNGTTGAKPDLSSVKDIVSDIDVRALNDGQNGYTKVTVITNRPVDIKTNTAKSSPVTQEQREYRALIAQQKAKSSQPSPAQTTTATAPAQKAPAFKLPEIQPTQTAADIVKSKPAPKTQAKENEKPAVKQILQTQKAQNEQSKTVSNKNDEKIAVAQPKQQPKSENNIKEISTKPQEQPKDAPKTDFNADIAGHKIAAASVMKHVPTQSMVKEQAELDENIVPPSTPAPAAKTAKNNSDIINRIKNNITGKVPKDMPATLTLILIPLVCIIGLFNLIRNSLRRSQVMKNAFLNNISHKSGEAPSYDNIINNENLSWQEKYQQYIDASGQKPEPQAEADDSQYKIVASKETPAQIKKEVKPVQKQSAKTPKKQVAQKIQQPAKTSPATTPKPAQAKYVPETTESRVEKFERLMQSSPSVEKTKIEDDIKEIENNTYAQNPVAEENDTIHKTIKLKAFAEKMALEEAQRNKRVKHRRVQMEMPKEAPHVNLGYSQLHSNPRMLKDANLSVSDLIAKSDRLLNKKTELKKNYNDYEMISVDEYFDIIGNEDKSKVTSPRSNAVAEGLANMKQAPLPAKPATNPIQALRNDIRESNLNGLIVKSGYDIDKDRGFYLVSLDGKSAIIGKSGEEIFVLKKFDRNIVKPLQVRMDNPNVYMVKADNFKSLVEVQKDKMGVLIEL